MCLLKAKHKWVSVSCSVVPNSLWLHGLQPTSCHFLLQGIFPTQGSNPCLLHCRQILYQLSYKGSPRQSILLNKRQFGGMPYLINLSSYWLWDGWTSECVCVCACALKCAWPEYTQFSISGGHHSQGCTNAVLVPGSDCHLRYWPEVCLTTPESWQLWILWQ